MQIGVISPLREAQQMQQCLSTRVCDSAVSGTHESSIPQGFLAMENLGHIIKCELCLNFSFSSVLSYVAFLVSNESEIALQD